MANPVITGVTVVYPQSRGYKHPGEAAEVYVDALDADTHTVEITATVTDAAGNVTTQGAMVLQSDPLTYSATTIAGHTVTQDPSQPNKFFVV